MGMDLETEIEREFRLSMEEEAKGLTLSDGSDRLKETRPARGVEKHETFIQVYRIVRHLK